MVTANLVDSHRPTASPRADEILIALRRIVRAIDLHSRKLLREVGLTGPQLLVLSRVGRVGTATGSNLARSVSLSQSTVTGILDRLEERGLVTRTRSAIDRRRLEIRLTPAGSSVLQSSPPLLQHQFTDRLARLPDWEQSMILAVLQRCVAMMEASELSAGAILSTDSEPAAAHPAPSPGEPSGK